MGVAVQGKGTMAAGTGQVGRYRLCGRLAAGGMATVHMAVVKGTSGFDKVFAVKTMHPHLARETDFVNMFLDEARVTSLIQHPNVCSVLDFGEAGDSYYLTMEYLMGQPLARVWTELRASVLPTAQRVGFVLRAIADACEGLHAAHELRSLDDRPLCVVHRDVSPHNLFVTYDGHVKVLDFGVASGHDRSHCTATGEIKGKFAYMAPEQLRGHAVDRRADIWSVGVLLWEMLAGSRLFARQVESDAILAVLRMPIPSLEQRCPDLPAGLGAIVHRCLSRDPELRYRTARDLARALRDCLTTAQIDADVEDLAKTMDALFPGGRDAARKRVLAAVRAAKEVADAAEGALPPLSESGMVEVHRGDGQGGSSSAVLPIDPGRARPRHRWFHVLVLLVPFLAVGAVGTSAVERPRAGLSAREAPRSSVPPFRAPSFEVPASEAPVERRAVLEEVLEDTASDGERTDPARSVAALETESASADPEPGSPDETPSPVPAARQRPRGSGQVNVSTIGGWGHVYWRGALLGLTPGRFTLPAGPHVLEIRPGGGGEPHRARVVVRSQRPARVRVELRP